MFLNILLLIMLSAGLGITVYLVNQNVIQLFEKNEMKKAYIYLSGLMFCAGIIVFLMTFQLRNIMIDFADLFYR